VRPGALIVGVITLWVTDVAAEQVSEIEQYGITWTFSQPVEAGQFASGDWWVVGPVDIESVSPAPTGTRNGSVVNPVGGRQGYDDRGGAFEPDDAASFPLTLEVDQSLVSSASKPDGAETHNVGCLQSQAVLTAVAAPPPPTALRPAYAGTYKRILDTADIDWSILPGLAPPGSAPDGGDLLRMAERPRIDHIGSWTIQHSCAEDNWYNGEGQHACYGREYSTFISDAAMYLMLDTPERDELAISIIQLGIDNYGAVRAGALWPPDGGHHSGRKWPIVFAGLMLNDCDLRAVGEDHGDPDTGDGHDAPFSEDGHTYYGAGGTALFGWDCGGGYGTYFEDGCTGAGAQDCRDPDRMVDGCESYRNCCTSAYWVGQMLATLMIGGQETWAHDAYFDYVDRWMAGDVEGGGAGSSGFVEQMWQLYRGDLPPAPGLGACGIGGGDGGPVDPQPDGGTDQADGDGGGCGCATTGGGGSWIWLLLLACWIASTRTSTSPSTR
jgi:MYXO-CTERM domain-containing protein